MDIVRRVSVFVVRDIDPTADIKHIPPAIAQSQGDTSLEVVEEWLRDSNRVIVDDIDSTQRTIRTVSPEEFMPISSTDEYYQQLSPLLQYLVVFDLYEHDSSANATVYSGVRNQLVRQRYFSGDAGENGMDCATSARECVGVNFDWDWSNYAVMYPLTRNI